MKKSEVSPMMEKYLETKKQYQDCILFYRLGDFYEMFNEDAIVASKELDLTLTGKSCGQEERAPMCGVPYHAYEQYAQKLIERGYKVAICEQTDKIVDKIMQREVVRIITPGTVVDTEMLNETVNSYMMSIFKSKNTISYAYSDLSTGEMCVGSYTGDNVNAYINDQIVRVSPTEIICNTDAKLIEKELPITQSSQLKFEEYYNWAYEYHNALDIIKKQYNLSSVKGFDFNKDETISAVGALLQYFKETQKRELKHLRLPKVLRDDQYMYIDTNTRKNLEIEQSMHNNTKYGSLLWVLDKTKTNGGSRTLRNWLREPLQDKAEINYRLNLVDYIYSNIMFRTDLGATLENIHDIERLVGKVAYGNITPKDCIALSTSLTYVPQLKQLLLAQNNKELQNLAGKLADTSSIVSLINSTITEDPPAILKDGGYIKRGCNSTLDELYELKNNSEDVILGIQTREKEATGIKNLKIGYNRVFGYYIEVGKQFAEMVPYNWVRKQTISNNERYITEELKELEEKILSSGEKAVDLESKIYAELKNQLLNNTEVMQEIAYIVSKIDCLYSLAVVAYENNYVKPNIVNTKEINIVNGRHPVIEKLNKADFIPNDCALNDNEQRTMILTGPNMAGKSTYMRQVALITYMAHIGSFVPADRADICIVDRIFTRIGASDDLAVGQSTFMVEMIEVANILNFCTNNSLIILDEVGRGTSTFDGLSIAWAVVEYLATHLNAKTLFATHYHELMKLEGIYDGVKNFCISIKEIGGKLVFLRKINKGCITRSYGIEVASLAGLPDGVISRAKELLLELENENQNQANQTEFLLTNKLNNLDVETLSPLEAQNILFELKGLIK